ncbi:ABC transporter substrate-binding protein [Bullifex porci]|uniref:ABC transporter substrate-binding protein n=1 Tax=Bullifex porci TaxID=2606638 RepID=UPI0023F245E9|nr:ABC transporter substrate-binding protein [Bullifex porci]MDD7255462.1 ABC transporter substrate-binding protein [Bullifex porci]MDY2741357.1 ABC transporter substrate-binding protein [Bullifex porci]
MKKLLTIALLILLTVSTIFASGAKEETGPKTYKIGVSKLLTHPALDAIAQGISDYMATTDIPYEIKEENANGDISTCASIAALFKEEKVDVAVGIATPTAQAIFNALPNTLQVYSSVTDPVSAGLTGNDLVCGVSDMVPVATHLELIEKLTGSKTVGMVYTSSEANGISLMEAMKAAAEAAGVKLITVAVANSAEVRVAAQSIIDRVDAMYVATDNTVISAITALSDVCIAAKVPLFSADTTSSFDTDVLLAGGFDYYKSGLLTGQLIEKVIKGTKPTEIGMTLLDEASLELYINLDVADKLGITIPEDMKANAAYLIKDGKNIK